MFGQKNIKSKFTPRDPTRQSSLWLNKRLTYQNYWTGVGCVIISFEYWFIKPILTVGLSNVCVCSLSIKGIAGFEFRWDMDACLL